MGSADIETHATLDMREKFAMIATVIFSIVIWDTQGFADGFKCMGGANLHHFANISILKSKALKKLLQK